MTDSGPTDRCPQCNARTAVRLQPGEFCAICKSSHAWQAYSESGRRLVIGYDDIAEADARRAGEAAGESLVIQTLRFAPAAVSLALAAGGVFLLAALMRSQELEALADLQAGLVRLARGATILGVFSLVFGWIALKRLRKSRLFRVWPLLLCNAAAVIVGVLAIALGGFQWSSWSSGLGWRHNSMPLLEVTAQTSPITQAIMKATAVILAPGRDGDARGMSIGAGAVIHSDATRAWIVTCSHVAMPYRAVASRRGPSHALPVWVYLSDGQNSEGRIVWAGEPPLDVAIVTIEADRPPKPIEVAEDADLAGQGTPVTFVPNPLRDGWAVRSGAVATRKSYLTPAGEYSLLLTDLPVQPGDSGSGLFDGRGRLIGLNTWVSVEIGGTMGISLPADVMKTIVRLIDENKLNEIDRIWHRGSRP